LTILETAREGSARDSDLSPISRLVERVDGVTFAVCDSACGHLTDTAIAAEFIRLAHQAGLGVGDQTASSLSVSVFAPPVTTSTSCSAA
jgi:hypothetical protein